MEKRLFTIAMILLLSLSMLTVLKMNVAEAVPYVTLQDAEITTQMSDAHWGTAKNVVVTDITGAGVRITFDPNTPGIEDKLAIRDDFPVDQLAGGALYDLHYGDFRGYTAYRMTFNNNGGSDLKVALFMNTGYTSSDPTRDTFWQSDWITISASSSAVVTLDFSSATCVHADDDPVVEWRHPDGTSGVVVRRLEEVSNIGFQMLSSQSADVVVSDITRLYMDPGSVVKGYGDIGGTFDVTAKIEGVNDLYGLDFEIRWDNSLITYSSETYSDYLNAVWGSGQWQVPPETHKHGVIGGEGYCKFVAVCTHTPPGFSTSGNQAILKLTFNVIDPLTNSKRTTAIRFETHKLSDSNSQPISHTAEDGAYEISGKTPTLSMLHLGFNSRTCRQINEPFAVKIDITDAASITDFNFQIDYDSTMLDYDNANSVVNWGSGTIVEGPSGRLIGTTHSDTGPQTGSITLVTIRFKSDPSYMQKWKDPSTGQSSNLFVSGVGIKLWSATLKYPSPQPDLAYVRGGTHEINPPTDFSYTFYPIKGDLNNDGIVDISDLSAVATRYDTENEEYNLVGGSPYLVDIFDLVVVASNFWSTYTPPSIGP